MIPDDVKAFLQTSLPSVWTLELLLLMRRTPARVWSADELIRELRASALVVARACAALAAAGLAVEDEPGKFRYQPARPELAQMVERLAAVYVEFPFAVTQAILAAPSDKVRTFADAFRLKKD
ncbi:MAG TPA: hypothetical protein VLV50_01150 [Stellaceae bacterium]|nr:hypothetical protein [Stellaceae bacterium]